MKKFLFLVVLLVTTTFVNAQTAAAKPAQKQVVANPKQVANPAAYACMKCYNIEKGDGKCSKCQTEKVQLGTYYCAHCMKATGTKAGKCDMCKAETTQMTRKLCATKTKPTKTKEAPKKAA